LCAGIKRGMDLEGDALVKVQMSLIREHCSAVKGSSNA
jgi:hypothetical protein